MTTFPSVPFRLFGPTESRQREGVRPAVLATTVGVILVTLTAKYDSVGCWAQALLSPRKFSHAVTLAVYVTSTTSVLSPFYFVLFFPLLCLQGATVKKSFPPGINKVF